MVDIQQEMLDHVGRRAVRAGVRAIKLTRADARDLPFPDATFDAVYMVTALGEIPEPGAALREAVRVLAPAGRLVVGEFFDRHWIAPDRLRDYADDCHLHLETRLGPNLAYLARFRRCAAVA